MYYKWLRFLQITRLSTSSTPSRAKRRLVAKFTTLAEQHATAVEVEEWGKRKLAYEIDDQTEGYYVLMTFTSGADFPAELDRIFGITDGIMRSMIVCKGE